MVLARYVYRYRPSPFSSVVLGNPGQVLSQDDNDEKKDRTDGQGPELRRARSHKDLVRQDKGYVVIGGQNGTYASEVLRGDRVCP